MGETIQRVIGRLDEMVVQAQRDVSRLGYFAALYRRVTRAIASELSSFRDPPLLESLDVVFAQRYFDAYETFLLGRRPSRAWATAMAAATNPELIAMQHLVAGISAHINLDLGIAVAQIVPAERLQQMKPDFDRVNDVLAALMPRVQADLAEISPLIGRLDAAFGPVDSTIGSFSLRAARDWAWTVATTLAWTPVEFREWQIRGFDRVAAALGTAVIQPPRAVARVFQEIRAAESSSVAQILRVLAA